jgi:hypothetical protein
VLFHLEQIRIYRNSLRFIFSYMGSGIIFSLLMLLAIPEGITLPLIAGFLFSLSLICTSLYYLLKRLKGKGIYWDEEGVILNFKGNKVYWYEIEKIELKKRGGKSTLIFPHNTYCGTIQKRHHKGLPRTCYAILWFEIENPNEFHKNLIKASEEKGNIQISE